MYMFPDMIMLGLKDGQRFPSKAHEKVAVTLAIGNPDVRDRDTLSGIVQAVISVPISRIKNVSLGEMREEFGCPI